MGFLIQMMAYGPPSVLTRISCEVPHPGPGEAVVSVVASAVNRADCEIRSGKWPIQATNPFPYVPGIETVGRVDAVGPGVKLSVGTPVITMMQRMAGIHGERPGGYQTHVRLPAHTLAILPEGTDLIELAAVGLAGVTAFHGIDCLRLEPEMKILVQGAAGGVGSMAVQLAKAKGAFVIAPVRFSSKSEALRDIGVDEVWDLEQKPWEFYARNRVDAVFEMVGGKTFGECVALLKPQGRLCSVGALTGGSAEFSVWDLLHGIQLTGWSSEDMNRALLQEAINELVHLLKNKRISPPPYQTFPLESASAAHAEMEKGSYVGRLLLIP